MREPIDGVIFVSPNGTRVTFRKPGSGLLIDRALMHRNLAEEGRRLGVHCNFRARAVGVSRFEDGRRVVKYEGDAPGELKARVVIDASGPGAGIRPGRGHRPGRLRRGAGPVRPGAADWSIPSITSSCSSAGTTPRGAMPGCSPATARGQCGTRHRQALRQGGAGPQGHDPLPGDRLSRRHRWTP